MTAPEASIRAVPTERPHPYIPRPEATPPRAESAREGPSALDLTDSDTALTRLLRRHFGIDQFRPWQLEAIKALVYAPVPEGDGPPLTGAYERAAEQEALRSDGRVLVVAPTGGGKSLCYQLPAVALPGVALVLSPLISLMEDQVRALEARGIPATFVASSLPREENGRRLAGLRRGDYKIVYAAPERLAFDGFLDALASCRLSLVAIDEAHCIVQWGHDFRPDYLRIGPMLERLRPPRVLACTATATPDTRDEILHRLGWAARAPKVILRGFARPNLHLSVEEVDGPRDAGRRVEEALAEALSSPSSPTGAGIIYAATRKNAERLADELRAAGWDAHAYHAGLSPEVRAKVSAAFADRSISVVVATNAFGMGIDRPDVRVVVHAQPPSSIEAYYQEVGRAGRDGAPARGLLLIASMDIALRRRMSALGADGMPASAADAARAWGLFRELLRYVDAATCRHDFVLRYFGDEAESLGGCGHCDVCLTVSQREASDPEALARDTDTIRRALAGVARAKGGAGMQAIAGMLVGDRNDRVVKLGLDRLSTFGVLEGRTPENALSILRALLANGWIDLTDSEFPVPLITPLGWKVMRGEQAVRVKLPPPRSRDRRRGGRRDRRGATARGAPSASPAGHRDAGGAAREGSEPPALGPRDTELFEALRVYRAALAREREVPAYVIAADRTLMEIALLRPRSAEELRRAHGMGPARVATYGEQILRIVRDHATPEEICDG